MDTTGYVAVAVNKLCWVKSLSSIPEKLSKEGASAVYEIESHNKFKFLEGILSSDIILGSELKLYPA
mgnify:CR=1 FL=1